MSRNSFFATKRGDGERISYPLVCNNTGDRNITGGSVSFTYNEEGLFARYVCPYEHEIMEPYKNYNEPIYRGDAVELFLSPNASERDYFEFDTSPTGISFNTGLTNKSGDGFDAEFYPIEEGVIRYTPCVSEGVFTMETFVPFSLVLPSGVKSPSEIPWLVNAYRIDRAGGEKTTFYAISPTLVANFHIPKMFGELKFK